MGEGVINGPRPDQQFNAPGMMSQLMGAFGMGGQGGAPQAYPQFRQPEMQQTQTAPYTQPSSYLNLAAGQQ
jgi:hypothetical protein